MSPMSLSLKESSTAFLSHWLTVHPPAPFSATRKLPLSRPDSAASTASRTSPRVAALTRSEERRVGKECVVRVDTGGSRTINKKIHQLYYHIIKLPSHTSNQHH